MRGFLLIAFLCFGFSSGVYAGDVDASSIEGYLVSFFGDSSVVVIIGFLVGLWTQVRANIPAKFLSRLPIWLISILDFVAGNYKHSSNDIFSDPRRRER
ncbi:hypothetical protein [Zooshikella sp. RANM57]|uniref:hypothetical protein n=1 Tax=Zooshikella sp. RANM57 TaxID=3425863 RepID=UPI003D6FF24A